MGSQTFIIKPTDRRPTLNAIGIKVRVLAAADDIRDQQITVQAGAEGMGPPPHHHAWDESFYVTQGQVNFTCDGATTLCPAGTLVHIPAGCLHAFNFGPGGGEIVEITGQHSQAVAMFTAVDREVPPGPPDVAEVVRVLGEHGVDVQL